MKKATIDEGLMLMAALLDGCAAEMRVAAIQPTGLIKATIELARENNESLIERLKATRSTLDTLEKMHEATERGDLEATEKYAKELGLTDG